MPEIIEIITYRFNELSDPAKEKARAWYREGGIDHDWFECVYDDFERVCTILGVTLETRSVRLYGGGTRPKPCIWFSGFWSQGDGASFEGHYRYAKAAPRRIREHAPQDEELHRIASVLQAIQKRNFFQLHATAVHRGRYCHEYCMAISVERDSSTYQDMTIDAEEIGGLNRSTSTRRRTRSSMKRSSPMTTPLRKAAGVSVDPETCLQPRNAALVAARTLCRHDNDHCWYQTRSTGSKCGW